MEIAILYVLALTLILTLATVYAKWREAQYRKLGMDKAPDKRIRKKAPYDRGIYEVVRDWYHARKS